MSARQQKQLAGLLPQRPSLRDVLAESSFPPDMHPQEVAHAVPGSHRTGSDPKYDEYFRKSGVAHQHGHQAHQISAMTRSGELKDKRHHELAHDLHQHAMTLHKAAGDEAERVGIPMKGYHSGHISGHEKAMVKHGKKLGKY